MFGKLLRLLKKEPKLGRMRRRKIERWDLIGTVDRDGERLERVPNWVLEQIERIRQDEWEHSQKFMNHYLRGKTYRYKLEFSFAASPYLCVYRSRQRKGTTSSNSAGNKGRQIVVGHACR